MSPSFHFIWCIFLSTVFGEPWYSIPLKLTANNEHFVTPISFGSPIAFELDIILDTGSGKFHIYPNQHNNITNRNIITSDTDSFECICQTILSPSPKRQMILTELNNTYYQFDEQILNDTNVTSIDIEDSFIPFLDGCPLHNETRCHDRGAQCTFSAIKVYHEEQQSNCTSPHFCTENICKSSQSSYKLLVNNEEVSFGCSEHCYSGIDIVSFKYTNNTKHNYVPYIYSDNIYFNSKDHDPPLYNNQSWADGNLGLVYDDNDRTSFWQILGIDKHSVLLAFDTMDGKIDIGNVSEVYTHGLIEYSEYIWWKASYHYLYIYSLSVCDIDLFDVLHIGGYYLAMIDTGATCLTLPPEIFDVLFQYIPFGSECNSNSTFCNIPDDIGANDLDDYSSFPMLSFQFSMTNDSKIFYISLKDLVIKLSDDEARYCIERGQHSVSKITTCAPDQDRTVLGQKLSGDCADKGVIIFGTQVLRSLYTIFDYPNIRIGFANNIKLNYTQRMYEIANEATCKPISTDCIGDDVLNMTRNLCQSGLDTCELYWGWTYDTETHFCVLQSWLYAAIPLTWIVIMMLLLMFVRVKTWIDKNIYYSAIKV